MPAAPDAEALRESSRTSLFSARYEGALEAIRRLVACDAAGADEYHNMAVAHYKRGELDAAEVAVLAALAREPDRVRSHYLLGLILKDRGEPERAVRALDAALARDPALGMAYFQRGLAHHAQGDWEAARRDLQEAAARRPELLWAHYDLGVVSVQRRDWPTARAAFERCLELDAPGRPDYVELLVQTGRAEAQEELYRHAHRIKNLLGLAGNRLRVFSGRIQANLGPEGRRDLEAIRADQERIYTDMVGFLNTMNPTPPRYDLVELNALVDRCVFAASSALEGIEVVRSLEPDLPEVVGDPAAVQEAVLNLLLNAADAIGPEGEPGAPRGQVHLTTGRIDDDTVSIAVADSGRGIPPGELARVFDLGFTTKPSGSGIGLAQVQRTVRSHGGRVEVRSEPGRGSCFTVLLPVRLPRQVDLRNLQVRSLLFEDLRDLVDAPAGEEDLWS
ncbi:MAG: tetratricopeptide repeat protein [Planctomycetes bacterium]|nr:tetratricopeptide repeat protein [Planctomycetota bacterium]